MAQGQVQKVRSESDMQDAFRGLKDDFNNGLSRINTMRDHCNENNRADIIGQLGVLESTLKTNIQAVDQLQTVWGQAKVTA